MVNAEAVESPVDSPRSRPGTFVLLMGGFAAGIATLVQLYLGIWLASGSVRDTWSLIGVLLGVTPPIAGAVVYARSDQTLVPQRGRIARFEFMTVASALCLFVPMLVLIAVSGGFGLI